MSDVLRSYIPKFLVDINRDNKDSIKVNTQYLSSTGDVYELEKRTVSPVLLQTTQSIQELQPETSNKYPFKTVTPLDYDGSTMILVPSVETVPTASQGYYAPIYFERYNQLIIQNVDTSFKELVVGPINEQISTG